MPQPVDLVIFDCDGTLVDSEPLANSVFIETVNKLGARLSHEEVWENFIGTSLKYCMDYTAAHYNIEYPENFVEDYRARLSIVFSEKLQPIPGALELVSSLKVPICIGSNGPLQKMRENLDTTGLLPYFGNRIFSAYEIEKWKPEPDLFLHAAKTCGANPERCLVIEDSSAGIEAAKAAGIPVLAFVPDSIPHTPNVKDVPVIKTLGEVRNYLEPSAIHSS